MVEKFALTTRTKQAKDMALIYRIASTLGLYGPVGQFRIRIHIIGRNEFITVDGVTGSTLVRQLKDKIEELAGIPG